MITSLALIVLILLIIICRHAYLTQTITPSDVLLAILVGTVATAIFLPHGMLP